MAKEPLTVLPVPDGIAAHWDLPQDVAGIPLPGGYHNEIVRCGDVVIRLEEREAASIAWEHELLAWPHPEVPEVVAPLPAKDGSTFLVLDGRIASVLPYVDGTPAEGTAPAAVLARIHARGSAWPPFTATRRGRTSSRATGSSA